MDQNRHRCLLGHPDLQVVESSHFDFRVIWFPSEKHLVGCFWPISIMRLHSQLSAVADVYMKCPISLALAQARDITAIRLKGCVSTESLFCHQWEAVGCSSCLHCLVFTLLCLV